MTARNHVIHVGCSAPAMSAVIQPKNVVSSLSRTFGYVVISTLMFICAGDNDNAAARMCHQVLLDENLCLPLVCGRHISGDSLNLWRSSLVSTNRRLRILRWCSLSADTYTDKGGDSSNKTGGHPHPQSLPLLS